MIKSQFIIIGVLSLIAAVATTSTLSAYALVERNGLLTGSDVLQIANDASQGKGLDVQSVISKANPLDKQPVKDLADKISSQVDLEKLLSPNQQDPRQMLGGIGSSLPISTPSTP